MKFKPKPLRSKHELNVSTFCNEPMLTQYYSLSLQGLKPNPISDGNLEESAFHIRRICMETRSFDLVKRDNIF